jgi:hypothetical protein
MDSEWIKGLFHLQIALVKELLNQGVIDGAKLIEAKVTLA